MRSIDSKARTLKTGGYYAAFIALGISGAALGPTLPDLAQNTHSRLSEISVLFSARSLGYLVGSFQGGRLYDRLRGHWVMGAVLVAMAGLLALVPLISALWPLAVVLLLLGVAEGVLDVGGNTLLVWVHRDRVGPYMNGLHFCFGMGSFLAPIIVAQVSLISDGIAWSYWALALLILPVVLWLFRLPSPLIRQPHDEADGPTRRTRRLLVALIAVFFFLYVGAEIGYGGWVYTYAVNLGILGETTAAYLVSAFWGALTLGRLLSIPLAAKLRPRIILGSALTGCILSLGVILGGRDLAPALWAGSMGLGFSMAAIFPTTLALAERRIQITGKMTSWFFVGASFGGMGLPWALGPLVEYSGPRSMIWILLVDLALAMGLFLLLMRRVDLVRQEVACDPVP